MALGFRRVNTRGNHFPRLAQTVGVVSTTYTAHGALKYSKGRVTPVTSQTDKVAGVFNAKITRAADIVPSSKLITNDPSEDIQYVPCGSAEGAGDEIFETVLSGTAGADAPIFNRVAIPSGSTTTVVKITDTTSGSNGDFDGGVLAINGEQANIITSTVSAGVWSMTLDKALKNAPASGDLVIANYWNAGQKGVKLSSGTPDQGVSTALADKTGGYVDIVAIDLLVVPPVARVKFQ